MRYKHSVIATDQEWWGVWEHGQGWIIMGWMLIQSRGTIFISGRYFIWKPHTILCRSNFFSPWSRDFKKIFCRHLLLQHGRTKAKQLNNHLIHEVNIKETNKFWQQLQWMQCFQWRCFVGWCYHLSSHHDLLINCCKQDYYCVDCPWLTFLIIRKG